MLCFLFQCMCVYVCVLCIIESGVICVKSVFCVNVCVSLVFCYG